MPMSPHLGKDYDLRFSANGEIIAFYSSAAVIGLQAIKIELLYIPLVLY